MPSESSVHCCVNGNPILLPLYNYYGQECLSVLIIEKD